MDNVAPDRYSIVVEEQNGLSRNGLRLFYFVQYHTRKCPKAPFVIPAKAGIQRRGSLWIPARSLRE